MKGASRLELPVGAFTSWNERRLAAKIEGIETNCWR